LNACCAHSKLTTGCKRSYRTGCERRNTTGKTYSVQSGHLDELEFKELAAAINQIRMQSLADVRTATAPATIRR
jgi:hypothetical protein